VKVRSRLLLGGELGAFTRLAKALLVALEDASVGSRRTERAASVGDGAFGSLRLLSGASLRGAEGFDSKTLANAMKLGAREIGNAVEPLLEPRPFGLTLRSSSHLGAGAPLSRVRVGSAFARGLPFGLAELPRAPVDFFAPEPDEGLEGVALAHRTRYSRRP
jgi:hypothetical protein